MCWIKENESFNMKHYFRTAYAFQLWQKYCPQWSAWDPRGGTAAISEAKMSKCTWITMFFFFLNYVYLGLVEGISNNADLEFKREALFLCLPIALLMCFFLLYLSHSLYNSPEFLVYETGVFLFIILSMLAGYTQILIEIPHLGQCSSSQKALESHLPFKKKRFKAVWDGMTSMFVKSALAEYLIPWTKGNKKLIVPRTTLALKCVGQNMTT